MKLKYDITLHAYGNCQGKYTEGFVITKKRFGLKKLHSIAMNESFKQDLSKLVSKYINE